MPRFSCLASPGSLPDQGGLTLLRKLNTSWEEAKRATASIQHRPLSLQPPRAQLSATNLGCASLQSARAELAGPANRTRP